MLLVPMKNEDPEDGEHVVVTGCAPPVTAGVANVTSTGSPLGDATCGPAGHDREKVTAGSGVGAVDAVHPNSAVLATTTIMIRENVQRAATTAFLVFRLLKVACVVIAE